MSDTIFLHFMMKRIISVYTSLFLRPSVFYSALNFLQDFRYEVARLQKEREDAGLMVAGCEKRIKQLQEKHKVEMTKLQGRITDSEEMAESLRRELFLKQQASNKVKQNLILSCF